MFVKIKRIYQGIHSELYVGFSSTLMSQTLIHVFSGICMQCVHAVYKHVDSVSLCRNIYVCKADMRVQG